MTGLALLANIVYKSAKVPALQEFLLIIELLKSEKLFFDEGVFKFHPLFV
jgi:hypothetical protein